MNTLNNSPNFGKHFHRLLLTALAALILILIGACAGSDTILDIQKLDQNPAAYLKPINSDRPIMDAKTQRLSSQAFLDCVFSPWRRQTPQYPKSVLEIKLRKYQEHPGYGENKKKHDAAWINAIRQNMDLEAYPNACIPAIAIRNTDIRTLPTHAPHFTSFESPGQGYPFDNLQESAMSANTPVFISHVSRDKAWVLTESHYCLGWVQAADVALADGDFMRAWRCGRYACMIKDKTPICDGSGIFRFKSPLGSVFPLNGKTDDEYRIRIAVADENYRAIIKSAVVARPLACELPMEMTAANVASIASELSGEPYGWGGMHMNRDCSAMIKDLFAPFGLWLPRNSSDQAKEGRLIDLRNLSNAEKKAQIIDHGVAFAALLWMKGHIMLYIASKNKEPLVFHNIWGISTKRLWGKSGRAIIGRASVTTLSPGAERWDFDAEKGTLLQRLERMIILDGGSWPQCQNDGPEKGLNGN